MDTDSNEHRFKRTDPAWFVGSASLQDVSGVTSVQDDLSHLLRSLLVTVFKRGIQSLREFSNLFAQFLCNGDELDAVMISATVPHDGSNLPCVRRPWKAKIQRHNVSRSQFFRHQNAHARPREVPAMRTQPPVAIAREQCHCHRKIAAIAGMAPDPAVRIGDCGCSCFGRHSLLLPSWYSKV